PAPAPAPARPAEPQPDTPVAAAADVPDPIGERPAVAVLPFSLIGAPDGYAAIADAVPGELIASLSRLRWLKVIARGSSFRFRDLAQSIESVGKLLGATYLLTGDVELMNDTLAITVELADSRSEHVIWSERLTGRLDDVHTIREEIVTLVTSALELHIPQHEAQMARLKSPESLDAWNCFHLGVQHMYRFNKTDNALASGFFGRATALDPHFARAHAARSFTSFQAAFLRYGPDRMTDIEDARRHAERAVELDPMDPFGNFTVGRAHWLRGDPESGQAWLERSMSLSPSFAQGYYSHGWASTMAGDGGGALEKLDKAISLSPLDPFLYAMQSAKGIAYLHTGEFDKAALWTDKGARKPGAHYLISAVAAAASEIAGNHRDAVYWADQTRDRRKDASIEQFFTAFPFRDTAVRGDLHRALKLLGFKEK
ncbi:MAG: hypothetical protein KDA50_13875, partial [Rhodobacteraceae bacterium]|nr:hypothetical protein [Paracoccaceae bacterium]